MMAVLVARASESMVPIAPPVTVTATRIDDAAVAHLIGARVITAQEIARSRASTLPELLQSLPGIHRRELPGSPNAQIDIRGFGSFGDQNTLVLRDGVRVREYEQLTVNWAAIPLASIERIEILPASSAVLYGGGAIGGTINIVTKGPQPNSRAGYLGAGLATYETREISAGASAAGDEIGVRLHGRHYETDNYRDNNRVRIDSAHGDVRWGGEARSIMLKVGADDQLNGLPGVLSEAQIAVNRRQAAALQDVATQRGHYVNVTALSDLGDGHVVADVGYRQRDTAALLLVGTPRRNNVDTAVRVWTFAPRVRLKPLFTGTDNDLIVGADFEDWKFEGDAGPALISHPHSTQRSAALYAHYAYTWFTQTRMAFGAREQRVRYGVTDVANPVETSTRRRTVRAWDLSVRQAVASGLSVYARRTGSFRLPNVSDNFNQTFARVTLLEPQTAREWEGGLEGHTGSLRYRAAAYRIDLENEIFFDPVTLGSRNRQPTRREALELGARWQLNPTVELYGNVVYADARFRSGTAAGVPIAGKRVPLAPRLTLSAGTRWAFSSIAHADLDVRYTGRIVFDNDEANTSGREMPGYTVADLKLSARSGGWLLSGGVRNLFDKKYLGYGVVTARPTYSAFPAQERTLFVSVQYTFQ